MNARLQESRVSPALVTQKAVQRLPRWALLLFCAAYVIPGLFGRDPWKNEDIASFGHMWSLALGQASWLHPNVGGVLPTSGGVLPYWLGAWAIELLPFLPAQVASRALDILHVEFTARILDDTVLDRRLEHIRNGRTAQSPPRPRSSPPGHSP